MWSDGAGRTAETFAEHRDGQWFPVIRWHDGMETLAAKITEPAAIAAADDLARSVLHPWKVQP